jgi:hypothetical protein
MRKQTAVWTQRNGTKIRICDMADDHLLNTIAMLQRNAVRKSAENKQFYMSCPLPNGEHAMDAFESEFDAVLDSEWQDYVHALFRPMVLDAERRGLVERS